MWGESSPTRINVLHLKQQCELLSQPYNTSPEKNENKWMFKIVCVCVWGGGGGGGWGGEDQLHEKASRGSKSSLNGDELLEITVSGRSLSNL